MKKLAKLALCTVMVVCGATLSSCQETDDTFDPYHNWPSRNATYFLNIADSARTAIAEAKAMYGEKWTEHCDWRMYRSTLHDSATDLGRITDSICVQILVRGTGSGSPLWTDTVRTNYRGTLIPHRNIVNGKDTIIARAFDQSYFGEFDATTAVPRKLKVGGNIAGVATALQYMRIGDRWKVYVPQQLGYKSSALTGTNSVPAYSTLIFELDLVAYYRAGIVVPEWQ